VRKLRYIAPAVVATAGAAMVLGPALPANAENTKSKSCDDQLCLWYSHGQNSPLFETNANHIANLEYYDFAGTHSIVRNNAHSGAAQGFWDGGAFSDALFVYVSYRTPYELLSWSSTTAFNKANTLDGTLINNEASYYDSLY
jgi:hypothetical protein